MFRYERKMSTMEAIPPSIDNDQPFS